MIDTAQYGAETIMIQTITLTPENYEPRTTLGGGTVHDLMPWDSATDYVTDGVQFGVRYDDGHIDWLGGSLPKAFGDGAALDQKSA